MFGDLSIKIEGDFRLKFTLFEMRKYVIPNPSRWRSVERMRGRLRNEGESQADRGSQADHGNQG